MRTRDFPPELTARLLATYAYDPAEGRVYNRRTGHRLSVERISNKGYPLMWYRYDGKKAGIMLHRLTWLLCKGRWPDDTIDHIDGNRRNNRIENLRCCSQRDNQLNVLYRPKVNADTGLPGVSVTKINGKINGFQMRVQGYNFHGYDPYQLFHIGIMLGKRYV